MKTVKTLTLSAFVTPIEETSAVNEIRMEEETYSDYLKVNVCNSVEIRLPASEALHLANVLLQFAAKKLETELV